MALWVKRYRAIRRWCGSMSVVPRKRPNRGQVANDEKAGKRHGQFLAYAFLQQISEAIPATIVLSVRCGSRQPREHALSLGNRAWGDQVPKVNVRPRRQHGRNCYVYLVDKSGLEILSNGRHAAAEPYIFVASCCLRRSQRGINAICYKMKSGAALHRDWWVRMVRQHENGNVIRWVWTPPTFPVFILPGAADQQTCSDQESEAPKFVVPRAAKSLSIPVVPSFLPNIF